MNVVILVYIITIVIKLKIFNVKRTFMSIRSAATLILREILSNNPNG